MNTVDKLASPLFAATCVREARGHSFEMPKWRFKDRAVADAVIFPMLSPSMAS